MDREVEQLQLQQVDVLGVVVIQHGGILGGQVAARAAVRGNVGFTGFRFGGFALALGYGAALLDLVQVLGQLLQTGGHIQQLVRLFVVQANAGGLDQAVPLGVLVGVLRLGEHRGLRAKAGERAGAHAGVDGDL